MKIKFSIPYLLTGMTMLMATTRTSGTNDEHAAEFKSRETFTNTIPRPTRANNADSLRLDLLMAANTSDPNAPAAANAAPTAAARVISADEHRYDVVYVCDNGLKIRRSGGTRAWRNNNPGCIRYSEFARQMGAVGRAGGFAVFPDEQTGMAAIGTLLRSDKYRNLTISAAIMKYAPPHENDTHGYKQRLQKMTGLSVNLKICDLTDEQLESVVRAIRIIEGWKVGREIHLNTPPQNNIAVQTTLPTVQNQYIYAGWNNLKMLQEQMQRTM